MNDVIILGVTERGAEAARPIPANAVESYRPTAPSLAELEGLLREIGRGAVTPDMVDHAWVLTRPQFTWHASLDDIRENLADGDCSRLIDQAARELTGKPADALTVFRGALAFGPDSEVGSIKAVLADSQGAGARPGALVRGTVFDAHAGKPVAGALVYSSDALTRTDATGTFELDPKHTRPRGMIWIEADGYALCEYPAREGAAKAGDARILLQKEEVIAGRVVGPDDRPVAGAVVTLWVKHFQFQVPPPNGTTENRNFGFPLEVKTDALGQYALRKLPSGLKLDWCEIRHPEYRMVQDGRRVLRGGEANDFKLAAGCKVSGVVVDEEGRPLAGALAQIREPGGTGGIRHSSRTGNDGRFRFGNIDPGRWTLLIQPRRHAPVHGTVVATVGRAVDSQYVAGPSAYIGGRVLGTDGKPVEGAAVGWAKPVDERGEEIEELTLGRITYTAKDGTFRFGPLAQGAYSLTGVAGEPGRMGQVSAKANVADVVIQLKPAERR